MIPASTLFDRTHLNSRACRTWHEPEANARDGAWLLGAAVFIIGSALVAGFTH